MKKSMKCVTAALLAGIMWLTLCGFEGLEDQTSAGIGTLMSMLTDSDVEEILMADAWGNKVLANVNDYVSVRAEASENATIVGRLFKGCGGEILETVDGWTKIKSGNVVGYVSNDYLLFGAEAYAKAQECVQLIATSTTGGLRIRSEASTDAKIIKNVELGAKLTVAPGGTDLEDWVCVEYAEGKTGYVAAEYVTISHELGEAMTMDEIKAKEAAEKKEKLRQQRESVQASASELQMLAALIQSEAGGQPYEGKVAVGAVVMNRVRSGAYPNTIADVIYAPGQFSVVNNGTFVAALGRLNPSCVQAAQDALNGLTTVGNYTHFRRACDMGPNSIIIGNHVFY